MDVDVRQSAPVASCASLSTIHAGFWGLQVSGRQYLTTADVAAALGVDPATVSQWRSLSKPGKRYAKNPFPEPDHILGRIPAWRVDQLPEIKEWNERRVGRGVGGGTPSHRSYREQSTS